MMTRRIRVLSGPMAKSARNAGMTRPGRPTLLIMSRKVRDLVDEIFKIFLA